MVEHSNPLKPLPFTTDPGPVPPRAPGPADDRLLARRHLLAAAASGDAGQVQAFVTAAEGRRDPTFLPLVRLLAPDATAIGVLSRELVTWPSADLLEGLVEQWEAMCAEQWVTDHGLCRSVQLAFATGRLALAEGEGKTLRAALSALLVNVGGARGRGVRPEAYQVIKLGVDTILARG
ncbi:MAG TPA: hypothetical protein VFI13_00085 [Gemmatimonadales bacterium]|nr:hypothetical protein [Gemmatimonadales bacterium]